MDNTKLELLIDVFRQNKNQENLINVLDVIKDSFVYMPIEHVLTIEDEYKMKKASPNEVLKILQNAQQKEDIVKNGDMCYMSIFTNINEMDERYDGFDKIKIQFLDIIPKVINREELNGIVVNPFTRPFVMIKPLLETVLNVAKLGDKNA